MEERIGTRLDHNSSQPPTHKRGLLGGDHDGGGGDEKIEQIYRGGGG